MERCLAFTAHAGRWLGVISSLSMLLSHVPPFHSGHRQSATVQLHLGRKWSQSALTHAHTSCKWDISTLWAGGVPGTLEERLAGPIGYVWRWLVGPWNVWGG